MGGVVIAGQRVPIEGLSCVSWIDDPRLRLKIGQDGGRRPTKWIRGITLHTTRGIPGGSDRRPQKIIPGLGPSRFTAVATNHWWSTTATSAGAHLIVDYDGSVSCLADLETEMTYHATSVNTVTIGIEIAQSSEAELWEGQLKAVVKLVDFLTLRFGIQRQIPDKYRGALPRLQVGGLNVIGVYGHRDQTVHRGIGDPGDAVFEFLAAAGYERMNFFRDEDLRIWRLRQKDLGMNEADQDGIAGPKTVKAIRTYQKAQGRDVTGLVIT